MSDQNDDRVWSNHVVCLIDVLGQKEKLARLAEPPPNGQLTPEFLHNLKQTAGVVISKRDQFVDFFNELSQCTVRDELKNCPPDQQQSYWRSKNCEVKVQRFSDTSVLYSQIGNTHGDALVTPLSRVLGACCYAMVRSLADKIPVRGAVTIDLGMELEEKDFYGPALAEAHRLESTVAGYPRIVVSDNLRLFLAKGTVYSPDMTINKKMSKMAATCRSLLCTDIDGCWIIDYLGTGIQDLLKPNASLLIKLRDIIHKAYEFVCAEAKRFRTEGNAKLALRYHLLQNYFESRLPQWEN